MENAWSSGKTKVLKPRPSNENVPPLQIDSDERRGRYLQPTAMSPRFQSYAENVDAVSPLARYLLAGSPLSGKLAAAGEAFISPTFGARTAKALQYCGNSSGGSSSFGSRGRLSPSPLSSLENMEIASLRSPPMYRKPSTGDDDVIVMDDILVRPVSGGKNGRSSSSSGRGSSSSSSSTAKSVFKSEICKAREESGNCRFNSKCQFGRLTEEQRAALLAARSRSQAGTSSSSVAAGSSSHVHQQSAAAEESDHVVTTSQPTSATTSKSEEETSKSSAGEGSSTHGQSSHVHQQQSAATESDHVVTTSEPTSAESDHEVTTSEPTSAEPHDTFTDTFNDWSPLDDGIEVVLPGSDNAPSREEVDAYISGIQHGRTGKKRLPVFEEICKGD